MAQRTSQRKTTGSLLRAALRYLRRQDGRAGKRARDGHMTPHWLRHMMEGEQRRGYHYRPGGEDFPDRRITEVLERDAANGVYRAKVEFRDPGPPERWLQKRGGGGGSTFWPDHWTPAQVDEAVTAAFNSPNAVKDAAAGSWKSEHHGVKIMGYYDAATGAVQHGFPVI